MPISAVGTTAIAVADEDIRAPEPSTYGCAIKRHRKFDKDSPDK